MSLMIDHNVHLDDISSISVMNYCIIYKSAFKVSGVSFRPETKTTRTCVHLTTNEYLTSAILVAYVTKWTAA